MADWQSPSYRRGPGWYRRSLALPDDWAGKRVFLRFEAAGTSADIYVDGRLVGHHVGAFAAFCVEITAAIRPGTPAVLAVRVSNAPRTDMPPLGGDFNLFGGLYRPVTLFARDPICISPLDHAAPGVAVRQLAVTADRADISVTATLSNATAAAAELSVITRVLDGAGRDVVSARRAVTVAAGQALSSEQPITVLTPHLWDGVRDPYLYTVRVDIEKGGRLLDRVEQPLGLRFYRIDPARGFLLNGRPYPLSGVDKHQDREGRAWAVTEADEDEDFAIMREMGVTAVRLAHYQHSEHEYRICDRLGLLAWAELPMVNGVNTTPAFAENAKQQLRELIRQNVNHPAIFAWSVYNEVALRGGVDPTPLIQALNAVAKQEDPTRPTVAGTSQGELSTHVAMVATPDLVAANLYPGWYSASPADLGELLDRWNRHYGSKGFGVSEYGAGASINQHEQGMTTRPDPRGKFHPEEWQAIQHEASYAAIAERPFVWGSFVWVMFDFASATRTEGDRNGVNDKGLVTGDRKTRKDAYYFYKANWNPEPMVYITSRRHAERTQAATDIKVYSSCPTATLRVNAGAAVTGTADGVHVVRWPGLSLRPGDNTIVAEASCGGRTVTDTVRWVLTRQPGKP